ncbi:histamine N-methyltransferase-like [Saccoglossus kowalevskii]|uniref:Uncharacterized protein LOC102804990 n=1 Tax=Saccoglossus kowalevskii TaxID=10224 RepID=A0ABM0MU30_SACKO|nr:PREDICTED: uncharacterized protein LOC102804990 [Saccoglossus kowalevskii]
MAFEIKTKSITEDTIYYSQALHNLHSQVLDMNSLRKTWQQQWVDIVREKLNLTHCTDSVHILMIGAGNGYKDCQIVDYIAQKNPSVHCEVVEPDSNQMKSFREKASKITALYPAISFEYHAKTYQEYRNALQFEVDARRAPSFHLITCSHTLHYIDNWPRALDEMFGLLKCNGLLAITQATANGTFGRVVDMYRKQVNDKLDPDHHLTSDAVFNHLKEIGAHLERCPRSFKVDVTDIFDESSEIGNMLLDFILQRKDVRSTVPRVVMDEMLRFMKNESEMYNRRSFCTEKEEDIILIKS